MVVITISNQQINESATQQLSIFDAQGYIVFESKNISGLQTERVDVSNWMPGLYCVRLESRTGWVTKRLLVTR